MFESEHAPPSPSITLLAPEQEGSADVLLDLLIAIARRVASEQRPENVLELLSREKQAA